MSDEILVESEDLEDSGEGGGKGSVGKVTRIMARALWRVEWTAANPSGTQEDRRAAWKAATEERIASVKLARRALRLMSKRGVYFSIAPDSVSEDEDEVD
jgi:hypothetical protein